MTRFTVALMFLAAAHPRPHHGPPCAQLGIALHVLADQYHETPVWTGINRDGTGAVLTQAPDGATWSMLTVTMQHGAPVACMTGAGQGAHTLAQGSPT